MMFLLGELAAAGALGRARGRWSSSCSRCSSTTSRRWCRAAGRSARAATSRRSPTSSLVLIGEGKAWYRGDCLQGAEALRRAGPRADRAGGQGGARADQRHAPDGRGRRAGGARRPGGSWTRRVVAVALSLEAFKGSTVPFDARAARRCARSPGRRGWRRGCASCSTARRWSSRTPTAGACRTRTRCAARRRCWARSADALRLHHGRDRARARGGDRQPADLPGRGRRAVRRATSTGSRCRCRSTTWRWPLTELASFSERRAFALLSPSYAGLPPFLTPRPGLSSGLMIAQYAAAALVNECQVLAHPAGAGSIPTSAGQEDFNSMGALRRAEGARPAWSTPRTWWRRSSCAPARGWSSTGRCAPRDALEGALARVREYVPRLEEDRPLGGEIARAGVGAADGGAGAGVRCKGWQQEAALLMLENNLHPDVAEKPSGAGRLRRDRQGGALAGGAGGDQGASCSGWSPTRRCSCSPASRWACSRRTRRRRGC